MVEPVQIDHQNRRITFQMGHTIPAAEARSHLHRLLDLSLDALAAEDDREHEPVGPGRQADAG